MGLLGYIEDTGVAARNPAVIEHFAKSGIQGMRSRTIAELAQDC